MTELQIYYCDNDAVHTDPVGLDFGQFDKYVKHEEAMAEIAAKDAEIEDLKRQLAMMTANSNHFERCSEATSDRERLTVSLKDAEIDRYKRAVEWCLENGAGCSTNDSGDSFSVRDCRDQLLCPPPDIADIICPAAGEK